MPDTLWPTNNPLDVPVLDASLQAIGLEPPLFAWGSRRRGRPVLGTLHFYVDDYRFDRIWQRPELVVDTGCIALVEPNFSVFDRTPLPVALWQVYRKRWLARFWQDAGIRVWVDLNLSPEYQELNLNGVPDDWRAFATRGYETHPTDVLAEYDLVRSRNPVFLVYGGGVAVREICESIGAIHAADQQSTARDRVRKLRRSRDGENSE